jgi:ferritin-like protein
MGSEGLHESESLLDEPVIDRHRAIASIGEELEAVDWYDQRVSATSDPALAEVLAHNRDEEKEHAAMTIEWLRRNDATFDRHLRTYLFTTESIVGREQEVEHGGDGGSASGSDGAAPEGSGGGPDGSLGIGGLR